MGTGPLAPMELHLFPTAGELAPCSPAIPYKMGILATPLGQNRWQASLPPTHLNIASEINGEHGAQSRLMLYAGDQFEEVANGENPYGAALLTPRHYHLGHL